MTQSKRVTKRTDYPPDVLAYKEILRTDFAAANKDLHGAERRKAWNKFVWQHWWQHIYRN